MDKKIKCPKCKSTRVYFEISVAAKQNVNTKRVYGINKDCDDNFFEDMLYCDKCGYQDNLERFERGELIDG